MEKKGDLPILAFATQGAFEKWLSQHHEQSAGIWLKIAKKGSGVSSPSYSEALDAALCFGWIDGQKKALDGESWLQRFTPRKARSGWSKINCGRADKLIEQRRMRPPGLKEIEKAKEDGRWAAAYDSPSNATVPEDFRRALSKQKRAEAFFETLDRANRYAILYRLHHAKTPEARARKIEQFIQMLASGKRIHER